MTWKEELRAELGLGCGLPFEGSAPRDREAREANHRAILRRAMSMAATVLQEAHAELMLAARRTMLECDVQRLGLSLDDRRLELRLLVGGLALEVRRETGLVDVLQIELDELVDGRRRRIATAEDYFGDLVLELVTRPQAREGTG